MNNIKTVTTTTNSYGDCFGFTEKKVFDAMDEYGLSEKDKVKNGMMDLYLEKKKISIIIGLLLGVFQKKHLLYIVMIRALMLLLEN